MGDFAGSMPIKVTDGTDPTKKLVVNTNGSINVVADTRHLTSATDSVAVSGSVTVSSTDLDIRDLAAATDHVTAHLAAGSEVSVTNTVNIRALTAADVVSAQIVPVVSAPVAVMFKPGADVAAAATFECDYTVTSAKKFVGAHVFVGARGAVMIEVGTKAGATFTSMLQIFQQPAASVAIPISCLALLGDGAKSIHVRVTNNEGDASMVYVSLQGQEF